MIRCAPATVVELGAVVGVREQSILLGTAELTFTKFGFLS